jgi:hypothetical protein
MSSIDVDVGDTGWTRAWICDHCSARVERVLTGKRETTADMSQPEILLEYDGESFPGEAHPFKDWVAVEKIQERITGGPGEPRLHLCPKCAGPLLDHLLERCQIPTSHTEAARNVRPVVQPRATLPVVALDVLETFNGAEAVRNSSTQYPATSPQVPSEDDGLPRRQGD